MKNQWKWAGYSVAAAALGLGAYLLGIQLAGNFAIVVPGEIYRSNQPSAPELTDYSKRYGIKAVLNLRGAAKGSTWYKEEIAAAGSLGLVHIDFGMNAGKELSVEEMQKLAAILRDAPKPLLIHCRSGSDRTGLASVIYLNKVANVDEEEAEQQLSIRFGHIGLPLLSATYAMDASWEKFEQPPGQAHPPSSGRS